MWERAIPSTIVIAARAIIMWGTIKDQVTNEPMYKNYKKWRKEYQCYLLTNWKSNNYMGSNREKCNITIPLKKEH